MEYRKDIQGLRAIAVISVLLFHLNDQILPGGFVGVDIFFVISGFLISSLLLHQKENGTLSIKKFYLNRIKRILPAYYVFLLIITFVVICIYIPSDVYSFRSKLFHSFIFNSNNFFATLSNYFGPSSIENPLLHTWTLSIEMQFYMLLPFIIGFTNRKRSIYLCCFFCIFFLLYTQYQIILGYKNLMYFSLIARAPEFLIGVIFTLANWTNNFSKKKQSYMGILGMILILSSFFLINPKSTFPGIITLRPCGGTILIIANKNGLVNTIISSKFFVWIGELSYSIYLWHWGVLALIRYHNMQYFLCGYQYIFVILITFILSYASYKYIEIYFRKMPSGKFVLRFSIVPFIIIILAFSLKYISINSKGFPLELTSFRGVGEENHVKYTKDFLLGDSLSNDTLLLLGNSHGYVLKPFFDYLGKRNNFCFHSITNNTYSTIPGFSKEFFETRTDYESYNDLVSVVKEKIPHVKIIIIATVYDLEKVQEYISALSYLNSLIDTTQQSIIILNDYPSVDVNPIRKNKSILKSESNFLSFNLEHHELPLEVLEFIKNNSAFHYLNLTHSSFFREAPYYNDTVIYYDNNHLNKYGSIKYAVETEQEMMLLIDLLRDISTNLISK